MKWKILKQEYLEKNAWIRLRKDVCETASGKKIDEYYVMEMQDVSCVVAITKDKKIILIKEYKHGVQKEILQLPCGYIDKGETPLQTAQRELLEETGYATKIWKPLGKCAGSPGRLTHYYHFFLAEDVEKMREPKLDEFESVSYFLYSFEEAEKQMKKQEIDLVTPAGLFLAKEYLKKN